VRAVFTVSRSSAGALCQGPGPLLPLFHSPQVPIVTHLSLFVKFVLKKSQKRWGKGLQGVDILFFALVSYRRDGSFKFLGLSSSRNKKYFLVVEKDFAAPSHPGKIRLLEIVKYR
jgi:hypothetical protein